MLFGPEVDRGYTGAMEDGDFLKIFEPVYESNEFTEGLVIQSFERECVDRRKLRRHD